MSRRIWLAALCLALAGCGAAPAQAPAPTTAAPRVSAGPDLRGETPEAAASALAAIGLSLGSAGASCEAIGGAPAPRPGPAGSILCQSIPPDSMAPAGLTVDYVLYEGDR